MEVQGDRGRGPPMSYSAADHRANGWNEVDPETGSSDDERPRSYERRHIRRAKSSRVPLDVQQDGDDYFHGEEAVVSARAEVADAGTQNRRNRSTAGSSAVKTVHAMYCACALTSFRSMLLKAGMRSGTNEVMALISRNANRNRSACDSPGSFRNTVESLIWTMCNPLTTSAGASRRLACPSLRCQSESVG